MPVVFDHIAMAAPRIADAEDFLICELGGESGYGAPQGEYRWFHWNYPGGGRLEVIEPDGPPGGFVHRFLERNGPGIHHVTFPVPSLEATIARAEKLGYGVVGYDPNEPRWREAFLHPKQAMGIVVQLVQQIDRSEREWDQPRERDPEEAARAKPPVTVVGVRLRTADRERALVQWGELLEGQAEETPQELLFTWPGSGMRVAVSLKRGASDRSEAIELRADRPIGLPEGPHPVLGAVFRQIP